jgi:Transglycosylase SLT domain
MGRTFACLFALCGLLLAAPPVLSSPNVVVEAPIRGVVHTRAARAVPHPIDVGKPWVIRSARPIPKPIAVPPAPTRVAYTGGVLTETQVGGYIRRAGFPESLVPALIAIAFRESRFDPGAVNNSSGACGLFQLYPCPGPAAFTPLGNALYAREKCLASIEAGFSCLRPWGG